MGKQAKKRSGRKQVVYYVLREDQLRCLTSPTRHDMVDHLSAHGAMSMKELAGSIGKKPASIYHHLNQLIEVGLVKEVGSRLVNRRHEKLYATPSRRMRLNKALADAANNKELREIVDAMCRQTARDFSYGLGNDSARRSGAQQNLRFFRLVNRPTPKSLQEMNQKLDDIAEILWREPDPGSPVVARTWILTPTPATE